MGYTKEGPSQVEVVMAKGKEKRAAQCTEFLQHNVELLGFGNAHDALIQTVKELFENGMWLHEVCAIIAHVCLSSIGCSVQSY